MNKEKEKQITTFLGKLKREDGSESYPFTVLCSKCGSNNVTIYHSCAYFHYSSYTQGFTESRGVKCKDCGKYFTIKMGEI